MTVLLYRPPEALSRQMPARDNEERRASEARLVAAVGAGDAEALADLYDRYSGMLLGLAHRVLGRAAEAEEVLQEVFLQVWEQADRYDPGRSSVSTWLVLITRSRAIDRLRTTKVVRRTARDAEREAPSRSESPTGEHAVLRRERRSRLRRELDRLPQEQRQVLELAFFEGLTQSEIARKTGIPLGTVKTRTLLAVRKLRKELTADAGELL
ncbi:MAG: sigma-70 family RNA polymerase sigma factor [Thermoanaerobaculia bacterium]|nr:sigma-70 family RNA polymerase sigma factor [Thermoanaerobaculia bacterium]